MQVALTLKSRNSKTGPIPVSTTTAESCPDACPFKKEGCYADGGPLAIFWKAVTSGQYGMAWDVFCGAIAALPDNELWRHNQAGDLPGDKRKIDAPKLRKLVKANTGKRGFTYTHYDMAIAANRKAVASANAAGFTVNLSGNNLAHADKLMATGAGPVVVVLPDTVTGKQTIATPAGNTVVVCPASYRDDVSCATCGLCAVATRKTIVGFPAHGASKRKATIVASR